MSTAVSARRSFAYQPSLDGVRALAVVLVLLFHQGWLSGGYVGVSVFFTLSGYLITSLALVEHDSTHRLDVPAFYGRRIRRLMPASLVCLLGVVVVAWAGLFDGVEHLRRDLWAALTQLYNWFALGGGRSYAQQVGTANPSPLDHYWSLAIEEQFYWVWPLALVVILRRPTRGRLVLVGALTLGAVVAAPVIAAGWGPDAAYWATPARLGEILVGALLAVVLHGRLVHPAMSWLAPAGMAVILWAAASWPSASGPAYAGWLPIFALASVAVIAGLQARGGLTTLLGWPPLVALGVISYGVYLFHWPVFVVLDADRTHLPSVPLFLLRVAVTIALAAASFRYLERPIRTARPPVRLVGAGAAVACVTVGLVVTSVPAAAAPYWMVDAADQAAASSVLASDASTPVVPQPAPTATPATSPPSTAAATATSPLAATSPPAPPTTATTAAPAPDLVPVAPALPAVPARPVRLMIVGDSTAMATSNGLFRWARAHPTYLRVWSSAQVGCGMVADGTAVGDTDGRFSKPCAALLARLPALQAAHRPDVVLGMVTLNDLYDRTWSTDEGALAPADPRFFDRLVAAYDAESTAFLTGGATRVVWVAPPSPLLPMDFGPSGMPQEARYARLLEALHEVAARHPAQVEVVDLAAWMAAQPTSPARPDGLHFSSAGSRQVADGLLGPFVVAAGAT